MISSASEALKIVQPGDNVFIHTAAAAPQELIRALYARKNELYDVNIFQLHTDGKAPYANEDCTGIFNVNAFFVGQNTRKAVQSSRGSYIPVFLSEIPRLLRSKRIPIDVALISISPPDKHGYCSLGTSVDISRAAEESARIVIGQVNKFIPRTHGEGLIHMSHIDHLVEHHEELPSIDPSEISKEEEAIGKHIAGMIEDGSCLQMGIGNIPNAVLSCLGNHQHLGIHSEMFSDGILPLIKSGVIDGSRKAVLPGFIVGSFIVGSQDLYEFVDDNPLIQMMDSGYVNNTDVIRRNDNVVAINSAIEVDLSGQVCADSIGSKIYSGVGGQMDFIRGASLSRGGLPIIAMTSTTKKGDSKISCTLKQGAGVVTTRAHVHFIVTEYGIADLYGKTIKQRTKMLIDIAHPEHRERLKKEAREIMLA